MTAGKLFVTGASGFVGESLLRRLAGEGREVVALSRRAGSGNGARFVRGDLAHPAAWRGELAGADAVLHLAAQTGKAAPQVHRRVNVEGTRSLLEAAREAGVPRFLQVSTVAAGYPEHRRYPYGRTKAEAEGLVRASGLAWGILRPTIVLGPGSPAGGGLLKLARGGLMPIFGSGQVSVQPVHVDDVARAIATWAGDPGLDGEVHDLGGPEVLSLEELQQRLHQAVSGRRGRVVHLPLGATVAALGLLEQALLPVLPLTAGQLYAFRYDSTSTRGRLQGLLQPEMVPLARQIEDLVRA